MFEAFIANDQYNTIKKQANAILSAVRNTSDPKVIASIKANAEAEVLAMFPHASSEQKALLREIVNIRTPEDYTRLMRALEAHVTVFPYVTKDQIAKLFPKNKKLTLPDLAAIDFRFLSYLSWLDVATNKMFIVYPLDGKLVGIEGRYTQANKKNYCFICRKFEEIGLFTAVAKKRPANSSPDYYKSLGNYMCMDGHDCNRNLTDRSALESFIRTVIEG